MKVTKYHAQLTPKEKMDIAVGSCVPMAQSPEEFLAVNFAIVEKEAEDGEVLKLGVVVAEHGTTYVSRSTGIIRCISDMIDILGEEMDWDVFPIRKLEKLTKNGRTVKLITFAE